MTLLLIETHLEQDLSLDVLAERVGFSAFHFHRTSRTISASILRMCIYPSSQLTRKNKPNSVNFIKENYMSGFTVSEWIACPPKRVFEFISDSNNAPKIVPSVISTVKLTEGPPKVGTRYRETRLINGKEEHAELEVSEYAESELYAMRNVTDGIETVYRYRLHPERDGTHIVLVCEVKAAGVKKLMVPFVASVLKKEDGGHLQTLKKVLEEQ